jgi:predicted nucleotidyltransferase
MDYNGLMTPLALLAEQVGVSERTLRRAVNEGTLRARRCSPRKLEVPIAELRYVRRSWPLISALREALRTEPNVQFALLFGSAALGTDKPTSDIDLLVRLRDSSLDRTVDLATRLTDATGRNVDLVRLEDAEAQPAFLAEVVDHGRVLIDRDGSGPGLRERQLKLARRARAQRSDQLRTALSELDRFLSTAGSGQSRAT